MSRSSDPLFVPSARPWQQKVFRVIFGHDSRAGKTFDVLLIVAIVASVVLVILDSVPRWHERWGNLFYLIEWGFTIAFTIEYLVRIAIVQRPLFYMRSFYGIVDLLSILPTYLSLFIGGANALLVVRILRILRIFRVLKLVQFVGEADLLYQALLSSRRKIFVFIIAVLSLVVVFGAIMYLVEGKESGYYSIPVSMYWAIVTLTTVGYGDISPATPLGRTIASIIMILGYGIIAVPTGIYTSEITRMVMSTQSGVACPGCGLTRHAEDADFCRRCGTELESTDSG